MQTEALQLEQQALQILGPDGEPFEVETQREEKAAFLSRYGSYLQSLFGMNQAPIIRAEDPLVNHAWVYAASSLAAINIAQVPYLIMQETDEQLRSRRTMAKNAGRPWTGPRAGKHRRAFLRHCQGQMRRRMNGVACKGLEPDYDHPLMTVLQRPNNMMTSFEFWQVVVLWLWTKGASAWVLMSESGNPLGLGQEPDEIWPVDPDLLEPKFGPDGTLFGWLYSDNRNVEGRAIKSLAGQVLLQPHEVIFIRFVDPENPSSFISPLSSVSGGISLDMMTESHNRNMLQNNAEPSGVLEFADGGDAKELEKMAEQFKARHTGFENNRKVAVLRDGAKFVPLTMTPKDMDFLGAQEWNRDKILATMRTPRTVLGITESVNYATQLGQDKNYWDKNLLPTMLGIEKTLDATLLFDLPDNVVGMFDTKNIEALRTGLNDQIEMAKSLAGAELHIPPRLAMERVGLEGIEEYEGEDEVLVQPGLVPLSLLLEEPNEEVEEEPEVVPPPPADEDDEDEIVDEEKAATAKDQAAWLRSQRHRKNWERFRVYQEEVEETYAKIWVSWVRKFQRDALAYFDQQTTSKSPSKDAESMLISIDGLVDDLSQKLHKTNADNLESTFNLAVEEIGGVAFFELDDPRLLEVMEAREISLAKKVPKRIRKDLKKTLIEGIKNGESVQSLRERVKGAFKRELSPAKTLQIARTESAGYLNEVRHEMFKLQGFQRFEWVTAGDEHVRHDHVVFGNAGPKDDDFNYLSLVGKGGSLTYPHSPGAPVDQVVNCRCTLIPAAVEVNPDLQDVEPVEVPETSTITDRRPVGTSNDTKRYYKDRYEDLLDDMDTWWDDPDLIVEGLEDETLRELEEIGAILDWVSGDYSMIRSAQMGRPLGSPRMTPAQAMAKANAIERVAAGAPRYKGKVWRGARYSPDKIEEMVNSQTMKLPSFNSSSKTKEIAEGFSTNVKPPARQVIFEIETETGMDLEAFKPVAKRVEKVMSVLDNSHDDFVMDLGKELHSNSMGDPFSIMESIELLEEETEVLLMPNSHYDVVKVKDTGKGPVRIKLREIMP